MRAGITRRPEVDRTTNKAQYKKPNARNVAYRCQMSRISPGSNIFQTPAARPSAVYPPMAVRIKRKVGNPAAAVIRLT
jgi:hypothetical protein